MDLTIAYITARQEPMLDRFIASLFPQIKADDNISFIVVDYYGRKFSSYVSDIISVEPKPTVWQGRWRLTSKDYWAMSSARNTALLYCKTEWIAFLDDRCWCVGPWLNTIRNNMKNSVLVGPYDKHEKDRVSVDNRRISRPQGLRNCGGGWLFGGNFAMPTEWAYEINGFEEGCDCVGGEDYIFGTMLCNRGYRIDFMPDMAIEQDRKEIDHPFPRDDKGVSPNDKSHAMWDRFHKRIRTEFTPDLRLLRSMVQSGEELRGDFDLDMVDWYDGQLIREM